MDRAYYSGPSSVFLIEDENSVLGKLVLSHPFALVDLQRDSWIEEIRVLKEVLSELGEACHIYLEFAIPRMGRRADAILLCRGVVFVLAFKVGEVTYPQSAQEQVLDYALDLKNFHEGSHSRHIVPILIATGAAPRSIAINEHQDHVFDPLCANSATLIRAIRCVFEHVPLASETGSDGTLWSQSTYKPTPTIVQAARALYAGHDVVEISRSDAGAINLSRTTEKIGEIIEAAKKSQRKVICFVTGVPGAGKTLAGLNIANARQIATGGEHVVFLSGNGPLVSVLQEALARQDSEECRETSKRLSKKKAISKTKAFIQNIHHFRDDALISSSAPHEHVVVFDEAQRAWTMEQTRSFMKRKKGISDFPHSEPDFLISVMDRHADYAVIVCLIGGGQEINTGEAGLVEWFSSIEKRHPHWHVSMSGELRDDEYTRGADLYGAIDPSHLSSDNDLPLAVSVRSFRSERVSALVKHTVDGNLALARQEWSAVRANYPVCITRDLDVAKEWIRRTARGTERYGMVASSGGYRLKPYGIHTKTNVDPKHWFLNDKDDVRSSYALEDAATEFDIQGLELDWTLLAWDGDFHYNGHDWTYLRFHGSKWLRVKDRDRMRYLKNAYRVLLTRARQGMVIFVPKGSLIDKTRPPSLYDYTFKYLDDIGFHNLDSDTVQ